MPYLSGGALVLSLVALAAILAERGPERDTRAAAESSPDSYLLAARRPALSDRHRRGPRLGNYWDAQFMWIIDARKENIPENRAAVVRNP